MTTPTDRSVTPLVVTVLAGYALLAYAAVAPTLNLAGALLGLVLALAVLGIQVGYVSRPGVVHPREGVVVALLALACLVYVPIVAIGVGWIGFAGFLAGSLRILLPPRVGLAGLAVVVVSVGLLAGLVAGAPPFTIVTSAVSTLVTGLVVHGLTRWWQYTGSARRAPVLPAPPAAAGESAATETTPVETTSAVATPQGVGSEPAGGTADGDDAGGGKADGGESDATDAGGSAEGGSAAGGDGPAGSAEVSGVADGGVADRGVADRGVADRVEADGGEADGGEADGGEADGGKADGGKADGGKADRPADPAADRWADALRTARSDLDTAGVELTVLGADVELPDEIAAPFVELLRVAVAHTTRSPAATTCRVSVVRRATEARIVVTHDGATDDPDPEDFEPLGERFEDRDGSVLAERDDAEFTVDGRLPLPA